MSWGCYYWRGTPEDTWSVWAPPHPRSFAGGTGPLLAAAPSCHALPSLSRLSRIVCKNICKMFAEQKHFSGFPTDHIGGVWPGNGLGGAGLGRKQAISNNFHGWRRILGLDKKLPVKVGWWQFSTSLQVLSLSNTPGLLLPAQIREITHCYNFLWRWLCRARHRATATAHLPKPLIGIGAKLFGGDDLRSGASPAAGRRAAAGSPQSRTATRSPPGHVTTLAHRGQHTSWWQPLSKLRNQQ